MLFAIDIDGTIATSGNWFARWLATESGLSISEETLSGITYGVEFWQLPAVCALSQDQREFLREHAHAHHKDLDRLANHIPIPGAREALHFLVAEGARLMYTTCRPSDSQQLTREWLARYDFPCTEQVYTCDRYHEKFIHAHSQAEQDEPVIVIDDQISKLVPAFRLLVKYERPLALKLILRIALVQIGAEEPPTFPFDVPFPVLACPSWQREHLEQAFTNYQGKNFRYQGSGRNAS